MSNGKETALALLARDMSEVKKWMSNLDPKLDLIMEHEREILVLRRLVMIMLTGMLALYFV